MTRLSFIGYVNTMKRLFVLLSVVVLMVAASGIHSIAAAVSAEQTAIQAAVGTAVFEQSENTSNNDCCHSSSAENQTPHDHCHMSCAILQNAYQSERGWITKVVSAPQADNLVGNPLDLMERPPRILI